MKKFCVFCCIIILSFPGRAQQQLNQEQSRLICAQQMALFTTAVSGSYQKGISYEQFKFALCGKSAITVEGNNQLKVAYNFLVQGVASDAIIRTYPGKEIASSLSYLINAHNKGVNSDGAELFGGSTGSSNSNLGKNAAGGCRWYQFMCMLQSIVSTLIANWNALSAIAAAINSPYMVP